MIPLVDVSSHYSPTHFKDAYLKIERAREHMQEFDAYASTVFKGRFAPYSCTTEVDAETGEYRWKYFATREIITRFAILCGDTIHNLRAALDYAWYELYRSGQPEEVGDQVSHIPNPDTP